MASPWRLQQFHQAGGVERHLPHRKIRQGDPFGRQRLAVFVADNLGALIKTWVHQLPAVQDDDFVAHRRHDLCLARVVVEKDIFQHPQVAQIRHFCPQFLAHLAYNRSARVFAEFNRPTQGPPKVNLRHPVVAGLHEQLALVLKNTQCNRANFSWFHVPSVLEAALNVNSLVMTALSDKLKSLGVKTGAQIPPPPPPSDERLYSLERVIPGRQVENPAGLSYVVDSFYPPEYRHGAYGLGRASAIEALAAWAAEERLAQAEQQAFAFLDIETTGLNGGAGVYAFLVGVGRFEGETYHLAQFFLRDPSEEPAHLLALEAFLAPCQAVVTFNGKSFDIPLLNTRFTVQGWRSPFAGLAHIDLLHLARRLWRDRLPSRTLGSLELHILDHRRTEEDIPGWLVPQMYFDYLHTADARPLKSVFYHNAVDVISLAALLNHVAGLLDDPLAAAIQDDLDWAALGRLFEDLGRHPLAVELYRRALGGSLPPENLADTRRRLSLLCKRRGDLDSAVSLWEQAVAAGEVYAFVELAKVSEHERRDPAAALRWTQLALEHLRSLPRWERLPWQAGLERRQSRLQKKLS